MRLSVVLSAYRRRPLPVHPFRCRIYPLSAGGIERTAHQKQRRGPERTDFVGTGPGLGNRRHCGTGKYCRRCHCACRGRSRRHFLDVGERTCGHEYKIPRRRARHNVQRQRRPRWTAGRPDAHHRTGPREKMVAAGKILRHRGYVRHLVHYERQPAHRGVHDNLRSGRRHQFQRLHIDPRRLHGARERARIPLAFRHSDSFGCWYGYPRRYQTYSPRGNGDGTFYGRPLFLYGALYHNHQHTGRTRSISPHLYRGI